MSLYLDTSRRARVSVAICDRCSIKMSIEDLENDPNFPGLRVCDKCRDEYDPYRLPPRKTEDITPRYPRPDLLIPSNNAFVATLTVISGSLQVGEIVVGQETGFQAPLTSVNGAQYTFTPQQSAAFDPGEIVVGNTSGATATVVTTTGTN